MCACARNNRWLFGNIKLITIFVAANLHNFFQRHCLNISITDAPRRSKNSIDETKRCEYISMIDKIQQEDSTKEIFRNEREWKKKTNLLLHRAHPIWHVFLMLIINGCNAIRISIVFTYFDDGTTDKFRITFCHLYILSVHNVAVILKHNQIYLFRSLFFPSLSR